MKHFQNLLAEATALLDAERGIAATLKWLRAASPAPRRQQWISIEEEESRRQCERLEGFLVVLSRVHPKKHEDQDLVRNLSFLLTRITAKRALFGNKNGLPAAIQQMQNEFSRQVGESLQEDTAMTASAFENCH